MNPELQEIRRRLDEIDDRMAALLRERMRAVVRVSEIKRAEGLPVRDDRREREILARLQTAENGDFREAVGLLYETIFGLSRAEQERRLRRAAPGNGPETREMHMP